MAVKIRLARRGRKQRPYYHIIIADARAPRDGKFIEQIGSYNPMTKPATIEIDRDKAYDWMEKGAQPTDTVRAILRFKGVLYRKHLQRGVAKGAMTQEVADAKLVEWIEAKESKIAERVEETRKEMDDFRKLVSGVAKPREAEPATEDAAAAFREDTPVVEEAAPVVEEAAPVVEEAAPVVEEAAPVAEKAAPVADTSADETPAE
ncbi:MAG: small subunit ribosomal protein S16 [Halioglobus sp.]|jgi:small subunit ribosomal protein S16